MCEINTKTSDSTRGTGSTNSEPEPIIAGKEVEIQPKGQSTTVNKSAPPLSARKDLLFNIPVESGELDRGAICELLSANPGPSGGKCSIFQGNKPYNKSWPEHNRSKSRIRHLILSQGFGPAVETLNCYHYNIRTIK